MKRSEGQAGLMQFVKFAVVGVSNTAVDWIVYYVLINTVFSESAEKSAAKAISFVVAVINSYIWNTVWTFRREYSKAVGKSGGISSKSSIFIRFFVVSLIGWGVNYLVFKYSIGIVPKDLIALVFASAAAVVWNFFANKFWTYKK